jgi:hypothetical protein
MRAVSRLFACVTERRGGAHLQAELADGLAVPPRLLRGGGRGQLDVVDAEGIEGCRSVSVAGERASGALENHHTLGTMRSQ